MKTIQQRWMAVLLTAVLVACGATTAVGAGKSIAVLPFYDDSGYDGPWQLYLDVPGMLGDMLVDEYFTVIPMDSVLTALPQEKPKGLFGKFLALFKNKKPKMKIISDIQATTLAKKLGADYAITGIIEDFGFRRTGGGDIYIGGYKSYTARVNLSNVRVIRVSDGTPMGTLKGDAEKNERGLGLELFGKPRSRDVEFYSLDSLDFGSKGFLSSLLGITTVEALNKVQRDVRAVISLPDTNWYAEKKFKVISLDNGLVVINAGTMDGVKSGDRFRVFASESGSLVGTINITQLWTDHVSKAEILQGKEEIRVDDVIMPER